MYSVKLPPSAWVMKPDWPGLELDLDARGHHDGLDVAAQDEGFVFVRSHAPLFGLARGCGRLRSSAAFSVCQHRLAHFTRTGNSRTPDSAASLPRSSGTGASCSVSSCVHFVEQVRDLGARACP